MDKETIDRVFGQFKKREISSKWKNKLIKLSEKYEVPIDKIDIYAEWDTQNPKNSYEKILEKAKLLSPIKIEIDLPTKSEIDTKEAEAIVKYVEEVDKEWENSIQEMRDKTTNILEHYFKIVKENVEILVKSDKINGYILCGETATGKSYGVLQSLSQMNLKNEEHFVVLTSHITSLELYQYLYRYNGRIIVCDDVMLLFKDDIKRGMLLSALWGATGKRIVEYHTTSSKLKVLPKFEFTGKLIILSNVFPKELESLKSRCLYQELKFNVKEKKEIILEICKINSIPQHIFDFINLNCDESTKNLNFRLPIKIYEIYKNKQENWEKLSLIQLESDEKISIIKDLISKGLGREEMLKEWRDKTKLQSQSRMYDYISLYKERAGFSDFPK